MENAKVKDIQEYTKKAAAHEELTWVDTHSIETAGMQKIEADLGESLAAALNKRVSGEITMPFFSRKGENYYAHVQITENGIPKIKDFELRKRENGGYAVYETYPNYSGEGQYSRPYKNRDGKQVVLK
jgi:hypothetical protein